MYVEMKHIEKNYGSFHASRDVSFGIDKGKLVALLGPSGSGKTTILRMLAGLENPNSGDIFIDGRRVNDIPAAKRGIGFVFQNYALFRYMTVYDNVAFGLEIQKRPKEEIRQRVLEMIDLVGLSGMEKRYPNQLSGGQRQRVAFARALGEYGATSMLIGYIPKNTATISTTVYQLWRTNDEYSAFIWVLVNIAISAVVLLTVNLFEKRSRERRRLA